MEEINIWDTQVFNQVFMAYSDLDEILKMIQSGEIERFILKDSYQLGDEKNYSWEEKLSNDKKIIYTDKEHLFLLGKEWFKSCMNKEFFYKHQKEFLNAYIEFCRNTTKKSIFVSKLFFCDEVLDILLHKKDTTIWLNDIELTDMQMEKIANSFANVFNKTDKIGYDTILPHQSLEEITRSKSARIGINSLSLIGLSKLAMIPDDVEIIFSKEFGDYTSEEEYFKKIVSFLEKVNSLGKKFRVHIPVERRSLFHKYFDNTFFENIRYTISDGHHDYTFEEFNEEEEKLIRIVEPILGKDFSPLERFLAVYNIVKNYKKYKENDDKPEEARYLYHILDNEYIVCVGFAKLLVALLDKVGIRANEVSVSADLSYDKGFTLEEISVERGGHARVIVDMDDDKYGVNGLYMSDPTWDNALDNNLLGHALMTFDKMQVEKRMFFYSVYNPILDVHNFEEFNEQVNYLLRRELMKKNEIKMDDILNDYKYIADRILDNISCDKRYDEFKKYLNQCKTKEDYENFYTEMGKYLVGKINQTIDNNLIMQVSFKVDEELGKRVEIVKSFKENEEQASHYFPYEVDIENPHNLRSHSR